MNLYELLRIKINEQLLPYIVQLLNQLGLEEIRIDVGLEYANEFLAPLRTSELLTMQYHILIINKNGDIFLTRNEDNSMGRFTNFIQNNLIMDRENDLFLNRIKEFDKIKINSCYLETLSDKLIQAVTHLLCQKEKVNEHFNKINELCVGMCPKRRLLLEKIKTINNAIGADKTSQYLDLRGKNFFKDDIPF